MVLIVIDLLELAIDLGHRRDASVRLTCQTQADTVEFCLDSALGSEDFSDPIDFLEHHTASGCDTFKHPLPFFSLSPSLRLTLNQLLIALMSGGLDLPVLLDGESPTLSRLRFWVPRSVS